MTSPGSLLGQRLSELQQVIEKLREAETAAIGLRHEANVAEWKTFIQAEGAMELRKITARYETAGLALTAENAEAEVRHLARTVRLAEKRVDVGRTYSADLRAEASVAGRDGTA